MSSEQWRKSSHSTTDCMEARQLSDGVIECRNSWEPDGPRLQFSYREWRAFVLGVREGQFDFTED